MPPQTGIYPLRAFALLQQRPNVFVIPNLDRAAVTAADLPWLSETLPTREVERLREAIARGCLVAGEFPVRASIA